MFNTASITILVSIIVVGIKFYAYIITGSSAFYSDALESLINVAAAIISCFAIYIGSKPADENHAYGHYKAEYISAAVEVLLIIVVAILILLQLGETVYKAWHGSYVMPDTTLLTAIIINVVASVLNLVWGGWLLRVAKSQRSPALEADGWHLLTDVVTSIGIMVGVWLAYWFNLIILDWLVAAAMGVFLLWQAGRLLKKSIDGLMDHVIPSDDLQLIKQIIKDSAIGAIEFHDLKTRAAGRAMFIEFHLIVASAMPVGAAHDICDKIEDNLLKAFANAHITIHIEPETHQQHGSANTVLIN